MRGSVGRRRAQRRHRSGHAHRGGRPVRQHAGAPQVPEGAGHRGRARHRAGDPHGAGVAAGRLHGQARHPHAGGVSGGERPGRTRHRRSMAASAPAMLLPFHGRGAAGAIRGWLDRVALQRADAAADLHLRQRALRARQAGEPRAGGGVQHAAHARPLPGGGGLHRRRARRGRRQRPSGEVRSAFPPRRRGARSDHTRGHGAAADAHAAAECRDPRAAVRGDAADDARSRSPCVPRAPMRRCDWCPCPRCRACRRPRLAARDAAAVQPPGGVSNPARSVPARASASRR